MGEDVLPLANLFTYSVGSMYVYVQNEYSQSESGLSCCSLLSHKISWHDKCIFAVPARCFQRAHQSVRGRRPQFPGDKQRQIHSDGLPLARAEEADSNPQRRQARSLPVL